MKAFLRRLLGMQESTETILARIEASPNSEARELGRRLAAIPAQVAAAPNAWAAWMAGAVIDNILSNEGVFNRAAFIAAARAEYFRATGEGIHDRTANEIADRAEAGAVACLPQQK